MMPIRTVLGDIESNQLGHTQCHEHLFIREGRSRIVNQNLWLESSVRTLEELDEYKSFGGGSVVDAQPIGCGRMPRLLEEVSRQSGVNVIASTGFHKLVFYPPEHWIHNIELEALAKIFTNEITQGMYIACDHSLPCVQVPFKAGMIKVALDLEGLSEAYLKLHNAAIQAAKQTGVAIQCHMETMENAEELVGHYEAQGFDLSKLILAHVDRKYENVDMILSVLRKGVYVQLDTIGRPHCHDDHTEVNLIKRLIANGFDDQMLMGLDTTRGRMKSYGGKIGLSYILSSFREEMEKSGISKEYLERFLYENPQHALSIV